MRERIIIDTDIGDDIDDVLAIALALMSPELDVIGITTVFKNTALRSRMAQKLLRIVGRQNIPVATGLGQPLSPSGSFADHLKLDDVPNQYTEDMAEEKENCSKDAVSFLCETILNAPGEITLVGIGPLTNIAASLIRLNQERVKIRRIVLMGGAYGFHAAEYNILCDPEAAKIVFESGVDLVCTGLDVTLQCQLDQQAVKRIQDAGTPMGFFLHQMIECWGGRHLYLHDPLAIGILVDPSIVRTQRKHIRIETKGEWTRGMTYSTQELDKWWDVNQNNENATICTEVDNLQFVSLFLNRITR